MQFRLGKNKMMEKVFKANTTKKETGIMNDLNVKQIIIKVKNYDQ